ncbi:MAG TPA: hypothetical protein VGG25_31230 [Streptosporangiaceae bacterium]|jgi:hypothetical protein
MGLIDTIKEEIGDVLQEHAGEIEVLLSDAAAVARTPLAAAAAEAVHIPSSSGERIASLLQQLEADFAKLAPQDPPPAAAAAVGEQLPAAPTGPAADPTPAGAEAGPPLSPAAAAEPVPTAAATP